MVLASLALCIVLGFAIARLTRRRAPEVPARSSNADLDRFIADLRRYRDEDATQIVRSSRTSRARESKGAPTSAV